MFPNDRRVFMIFLSAHDQVHCPCIEFEDNYWQQWELPTQVFETITPEVLQDAAHGARADPLPAVTEGPAFGRQPGPLIPPATLPILRARAR